MKKELIELHQGLGKETFRISDIPDLKSYHQPAPS